MSSLKNTLIVAIFVAFISMGHAQSNRVSPLKVSESNRTLVREDEEPFFWLGDTGWRLFHQLSREEADFYLRTRKHQGFTLIQAVVLPIDGHLIGNQYGELPFIEVSPQKLIPNPAYFEHVDWVINRAEELGMYLLLFPTWRYYWKDMPQNTNYKPVLTPGNSRLFAEYLGRRYHSKPGIIWGIGGDKIPENDGEHAIVKSFVDGLKSAEANQLMTYHPGGRESSSEVYHDASWLDFNMCQTAHRLEYPFGKLVGADYQRLPTKPAINGEPLYENIPRPLWRATVDTEKATAYEIRRPIYFSIFEGGFGATYGANSIIQFLREGDQTRHFPTVIWEEAMYFPGAFQMRYLRDLMLSRNASERVPEPALLASDSFEGNDTILALLAVDKSFAMVYSAGGKSFSVNLDLVSGTKINGNWFDPRTGASKEIGTYDKKGIQLFTTPAGDKTEDWVLILDDAETFVGMIRGHR